MQLTRKEYTTAIDLGSSAVKLARVRNTSVPRLTHLALQPVEPSSKATGAGDSQSAALRALLRRIGIGPSQMGRIVVTAGGEKISLRQIAMPSLSDDEVATAGPLEARKHLPMDAETEVDCQVLHRPADSGRMQVLLVAVPRAERDRAVRALTSLDLHPIAVDVPHLAAMNAMLGEDPVAGEGEKGVALLHMGNSGSILNLYKKGTLFYSRSLPFSGSLLAGRVAETIGIDAHDAAQRLEDTAYREEEDQRVLAVLEREIESLVQEVKDGLSYFQSRSGKAGVERIFLSGGLARNPKVGEQLSRSLSLPTSVLSPPCGLELDHRLSSEGRDAMARYGPQLSVVLGLARGWSA